MATFTPSFNQIAAQYDRQRAHPPEVSAAIGTSIAAIVGTDARVLELGVGTGRIAFPVAAAGCQVVGVDLAIEMLRRAQAGGLDRLVRGDITALPLRSHTFDAVLAVHVLHLVPDWRAVLAEAVRVLRSTGLVIQGRDWRDPQSCAALVRSKLREAVIARAPGTKPPAAGAATGQALMRLGATASEEIIAASWTTWTTPAAVLDGMARRDDAETWALPDDVLESALADARSWAAVTWDDLDAPQAVEQRFVLTLTRGAWREEAR